MAPSSVIMVTLFLIVSVLAMPMMTSAQRIQVDRPYQGEQDQDQVPQKRPFCNAFTGCGRKRSFQTQPMFVPLSPKYNNKPLGELDTVENYSDLPMEQNVDEIARQILAEAKLWEALQRASREMSRQRAGAQ